MSPFAPTTTVGSWPRRADGAMNPPSVVTSSSRPSAPGVSAGDADGAGLGEVEGGAADGAVVGATVGVLLGAGLGAWLVGALAVGWAVPQATATTETATRQQKRRFKADPLRQCCLCGSPAKSR